MVIVGNAGINVREVKRVPCRFMDICDSQVIGYGFPILTLFVEYVSNDVHCRNLGRGISGTHGGLQGLAGKAVCCIHAVPFQLSFGLSEQEHSVD